MHLLMSMHEYCDYLLNKVNAKQHLERETMKYAPSMHQFVYNLHLQSPSNYCINVSHTRNNTNNFMDFLHTLITFIQGTRIQTQYSCFGL